MGLQRAVKIQIDAACRCHVAQIGFHVLRMGKGLDHAEVAQQREDDDVFHAQVFAVEKAGACRQAGEFLQIGLGAGKVFGGFGKHLGIKKCSYFVPAFREV